MKYTYKKLLFKNVSIASLVDLPTGSQQGHLIFPFSEWMGGMPIHMETHVNFFEKELSRKIAIGHVATEITKDVLVNE